MTTEEKARAYDEALKKAKQFHNKDLFAECNGNLVEYIFPELKESEDERIRKALLELVHDTTGDELWVDYNVHKEDAYAWLEKQSEQKSKWSKEDECYMGECISAIATKDGWSFEEKKKTKHWLMSLKQRIGQ